MKMETIQIKGVDSTERITKATLLDNTNLTINEKLLTHGSQYAKSLFELTLDGENSSSHLTSRAVATESSRQEFISKVYGNNKCFSHVECDAIIKDNAKAPIKKKKKSKTPDLNINKPEIKKYIYKDENNNKYIYS